MLNHDIYTGIVDMYTKSDTNIFPFYNKHHIVMVFKNSYIYNFNSEWQWKVVCTLFIAFIFAKKLQRRCLNVE